MALTYTMDPEGNISGLKAAVGEMAPTITINRYRLTEEQARTVQAALQSFLYDLTEGDLQYADKSLKAGHVENVKAIQKLWR